MKWDTKLIIINLSIYKVLKDYYKLTIFKKMVPEILLWFLNLEIELERINQQYFLYSNE